MTDSGIVVARAGVFKRTAYALAVFPLDIAHRATIRAMLPAGATQRVKTHQQLIKGFAKGGGTSRNKTSTRYQDALRDFAARGWIDRGAEFVRINDRDSLLDFALDGLPGDAKPLVFVSSAVSALERGDARHDHPRRNTELAALRDLLALNG